MPRKVKNSPSPRSGAPIGVFDSGVGGLSVLIHLRRLMPRERFVFLADQSYVPYGTKSAAQLRKRCSLITRFLIKRGAKAVVVACNTATVYSINHLRASFSIPFIGTVPAIKPACHHSGRKIIAVLSTPATAKSPALKKLIRAHAPNCEVLRIGCPGLEEAVEHGSLQSKKTKDLLEKYLSKAKASGADQLVLGCTHYPFLKRAIRSIYPVNIVDSGRAIAAHTRSILTEKNLSRKAGVGSVAYWTTGDARTFSSVASSLLSENVRARNVNISGISTK